MAKIAMTARAVKPNGLLLWTGSSVLTGDPIALIVTGTVSASANDKTGNMLQTWIIRSRIDPLEAHTSGRDDAVCGDCPHLGGSCYVNIGQAPLSIYRAMRRGNYPRYRPTLHASLLRNRMVRLGAYGDPAACPESAWAPLVALASGRTGYTHQWRRPDAQWLRHYAMASCDSEGDRREAVALGWRTFRVRLRGAPLMAGEFSCPASAEAGNRLTCAECRACDGATGSARAVSPSIEFHASKIGGDWKYKVFDGWVSKRVALAMA